MICPMTIIRTILELAMTIIRNILELAYSLYKIIFNATICLLKNVLRKYHQVWSYEYLSKTNAEEKLPEENIRRQADST